MIITKEIDLKDFEPWSGAVTRFNRLEELDLLDEFESMLEELFPEGLDETRINDLLWFESDWIFETLGVSEEEGRN